MKALAHLILFLCAFGIGLCGATIILLILWIILGTETITHLVGGGRLMTLCICGLSGILFLELCIRICWHFYYNKHK